MRHLIIVAALALALPLLAGCSEDSGLSGSHCEAFCEIRDKCGWMGLNEECMDRCLGPADECTVWCTASVDECELECAAWSEDLQHAHRACLGSQGCDNDSPAFIPEYRDCVEAECTTCEW